jgi:hypothetical protein
MRSLITTVVLAATASTSFAAWTITNGNASMNSSGSGSSTFGNSNLNTANFRPEGGTTVDHMYYYNWGYRVYPVGGSGGNNRGMSTLSPGFSQVVAGDTATFNMPDNGPGPVGQNRFDSTLTVKLTDSAVAGQARHDSQMVITSLATNTAPFVFELFHIVDIDLNDTASNDNTAILPTAGPIAFGLITDSTNPSVTYQFGATAPSRVQVGASFATRSLINGTSAANLDNNLSLLNAHPRPRRIVHRDRLRPNRRPGTDHPRRPRRRRPGRPSSPQVTPADD